MKYEYIQRIPSHYVKEDCMQTTISHVKGAITFLNAEGVMYHYKPNSTYFVNKYIEDERKTQFPYNNIPTHISRVGLKKVEYINQLLDFGKVYIQIADGIITEFYALKDGDEALLATKYILPVEAHKLMTHAEIDKLLKTATGGIYTFDGSVRVAETDIKECSFSSEEYILELYKKRLVNERKKELNQSIYGSYMNEKLTDFISRSIDKMTLEDIKEELKLLDDTILVSLGMNEVKNITAIEITFKGPDRYLVEMYIFPITLYSLECMHQAEKTNFRQMKEPKISPALNPEINKRDIKEAKQLAKRLILRKQQ